MFVNLRRSSILFLHGGGASEGGEKKRKRKLLFVERVKDLRFLEFNFALSKREQKRSKKKNALTI